MTFRAPPKRALQRLRELIVYISKRSEKDSHFGATKLNKILYHSDFRAFERFGHPLIGTEYFRLPKGPAPRTMLPVRQALANERAIRIEIDILPNGYKQHRTVALRDAITAHFTPDELAVVDEVIKELWDQNATEVSDASHDVRWRVLNHRDPIPYEFAFLSNDAPTEEDYARFNELNEQYKWE